MKFASLLLAFLAISIFTIGCADPNTTTSGETDVHTPDDGHDHGAEDDHSGHDHAASDHTAPHGGHLVELGRNHEYHAELVDDHKTESVTIYLMDSHMKAFASSEPTIQLILTAGNDTQTFELGASKTGGSSEFTSTDSKMMSMIELDGVTGKIRTTIDGKPFSGTFEHHDHGHEGHDHDGHDH